MSKTIKLKPAECSSCGETWQVSEQRNLDEPYVCPICKRNTGCQRRGEGIIYTLTDERKE